MDERIWIKLKSGEVKKVYHRWAGEMIARGDAVPYDVKTNVRNGRTKEVSRGEAESHDITKRDVSESKTGSVSPDTTEKKPKKRRKGKKKTVKKTEKKG